MSDAANVIEVKDLSYSYGKDYMALNNVSLSVKKGEFVAIIGQNGAGKSTLLKNLTGLLRPTQGAILMNGQDIREMPVGEISQRIGFVLQNPDRQLFANTVTEEIAFGPKNLGLDEEEINRRVESVIKAVGLEEMADAFPPALSKGDRAKTVIASVLAMDPEIIILDEPTSGQDYRGCYQIMDIAKELNRQGKSIVVVTHHMALVAEYAQRTIVMSRSRVLLDDDTASVFAQPDLLATTHITPPQITQVADAVKADFNIPKTILSVREMSDFLMQADKAANTEEVANAN